MASPIASPVAKPAAVAPASGAATRLGVLTPLSPPGDAGAGQLIVRGAEFAVEYVNKRMGTGWAASSTLPGPIELVKGDDAGTAEKGLAAFRKLAQDDKVAGVMGQFHSSVTLAVIPVADQLKVPLLSSQSSATEITSKHNDFSFQTHAITQDRAAVVSEFIKNNKATFKKVAIVAESTDYGTGNMSDLKALMASVGDVQLRDWVFDNKSTDLSALLLQVKQFDPDLIYNLGVGAPAYLVLKQSYDAGLLPKAYQLISYDVPIRPEFWQNTGDQGKGVIFVAYYHPQQALTEAGKWMQSEYEKKYNEPAVYSAFQGFGNILVLAQAINQANSTEGAAVAKALETGKFMNWNADGVSFPRAEGPDWHRIKIPILLLQYTESNQAFAKATILAPQNMKTGDLKKP
jgi:branched-chain amino acid transport system substrate-binding protein